MKKKNPTQAWVLVIQCLNIPTINLTLAVSLTLSVSSFSIFPLPRFWIVTHSPCQKQYSIMSALRIAGITIHHPLALLKLRQLNPSIEDWMHITISEHNTPLTKTCSTGTETKGAVYFFNHKHFLSISKRIL